MLESAPFVIPNSLVHLTLKIAKEYEISSYNLFSALDTLEYALKLNFDALSTGQIDENEMTILIINILRLSEKMNDAKSKLTKFKLDEIFGKLQIDGNECNGKELQHFKSFNCDVKVPQIVEEIYGIIERYMKEEILKVSKDSIMKHAMNILKIFYSWRAQIHEGTETPKVAHCKELARDHKVVGVSIILICLNLLNVSGKVSSQIFDAMCGELEDGAKKVNFLAGVLFALIKKQ